MNRFKGLQSYFEGVPEVVLAYLFGSQANGMPGPLSDYDIGILIQSPPPRLRYRLSWEIGQALGIDWVGALEQSTGGTGLRHHRPGTPALSAESGGAG